MLVRPFETKQGRGSASSWRMLAALLGVVTIAAGGQDQAAAPRVVRAGVRTAGVVRPMASLTPQTVFKLPGTPDWSVVTRNSVWVSSSRVNQVSQLVPRTGRIGLTAHVLLPCSGLAYGWGAVWVPSCGAHDVERVDEKTGKTIASIPADPANSEGGITVGAGSVWVVAKPSRLVRIDPAKNSIVASIDLPPGSENPAFGGGFVWVTASAKNALLKVDPATNRVVKTVPVGPEPRFLTVGSGAIWTLNQGDGTVSRVDLITSEVIATITCGVPGSGGEITFGDGAVWATMFDFPITRIDPKTNQPVRQWAGAGGDGIRYGLHSVWLSNGREGTVWRLDASHL